MSVGIVLLGSTQYISSDGLKGKPKMVIGEYMDSSLSENDILESNRTWKTHPSIIDAQVESMIKTGSMKQAVQSLNIA